MNIISRWLFRNIPPADEAEFLVRRAASSGYGVFINPDFRRLINFAKQSEEEQNRIFNELVVTGICLLDLIVASKLNDVKHGRRHFWLDVREKIPDAFCGWINTLGMAGEFVDIWKKLIDLRVKEYLEGQNETREVWTREFKNHPDREVLTESAARVENITVGCMLHITRGKASKAADDPLRRHLRAWIIQLNNRLYERVGW